MSYAGEEQYSEQEADAQKRARVGRQNLLYGGTGSPGPAVYRGVADPGRLLHPTGRFEHSLKVDQQLSRLEPANPLVFYNLACSYALNSEVDAAATALDKALSLGYRDFKWLAKDPDLRRLRQHPLYRGIEDKIRKMKVRIA